MKDEVSRLDLEYLHGLNDPTARDLVSKCIQSNFALTEEIGKFSEQLIVLDGNPRTLNSQGSYVPGKYALASNEFKLDWPNSPVSPADLFSQKYKDMAAPGYRDCVLQTSIVIEHIECSNASAVDVVPVSYARALIPVTNGLGAWFILCYAFDPIRDRYPTAFGSTEQFQPDRIPRKHKSSYALLAGAFSQTIPPA